MISLVAQHRDAIRELCQEFDVVRIEVFGSAATGDFDPDRSDVDLLIEYAPGTDLGPWVKRSFDLKERLETLLGRPVDLVMTGALRNPYFIRAVNESKLLLYAAEGRNTSGIAMPGGGSRGLASSHRART